MVSSDVMHPWLLNFKDATLEAAYQRYALYRHHRLGDQRFFFVSSVVVLSVAVKTACAHNWRLLPALPSFLCGTLLVVLWLIYLNASTRQVLKMRPYMSVASRLSITITGVISKHSFSWMFSLMPQAPLAILHFLLATETLGNLPYAFGIVINFREHLPTQILAFSIFLFGKATTFCEKMRASAGAAALETFETYVDDFFESWASFLFSTMGSFRTDSIPKMPCLHLTTFLMTFFSMGVVSYLIWESERKLRFQFLSLQASQPQQVDMKNTDTGFNCIRYLTLISLGALFWKYCIPLTNLVSLT